jgi:hypothetical protein
MTADELKTAYEVFKQIQYDSKPPHEQFHSRMTTNDFADQDYFVKFSSWVKQSYPDVWEAWRAIQDIENSGREYVPIQMGR